ncbi:MAG: hypothetical protein N2Z21_00680, partial [Candidatus Sumerlaeaceae bacterium]|nr:hypothetical protein [Candidatus Sumerlaeaceae bacterium]
KLEEKVHHTERVTLVYGNAQIPLVRVLATPQVSGTEKRELKAWHPWFNPFQLHRDIQQQMKQIEAIRVLRA